jgi:protocatechuate 3,4-dioxygenase beta subunit
MDKDRDNPAITRRQALAGAAGLGAGVAVGTTTRAEQSGAKLCVLTPEAEEGPFYFDPELVRADITEGKQGAPLKLALQVVEAKDCTAIKDARVDIWHADGLGAYSGFARQATGSTKGQTFLRGTQFTNGDGQTSFATIYPGWYPGRTPHIHFKVFLDGGKVLTGQLYFPDPVTDRVYAELLPYRERKGERDTLNSSDGIFRNEGGAQTVVNLTEEDGTYLAALVLGVERG